jgi:O-methyltransferase
MASFRGAIPTRLKRLVRRPAAAPRPATAPGTGVSGGTEPLHPVIRRVRRQKLTYLPVGALNDLFEAARAAEREQRPGVLIEAGCALGGSAIVLSRAKAGDRVLYVYDVFGMIPPPTEADGPDVHERYATISAGEAKGLSGETYYGYEPDLLARVSKTFDAFGMPPAEHHVRLVQGLFHDTLAGDEPVALAHIDGDWHDSVMTCLERIGPRLSPGGVMVIDDYFKWSGCRTAVDTFLAAHPDDYTTVRRTRLHVIRR